MVFYVAFRPDFFHRCAPISKGAAVFLPLPGFVLSQRPDSLSRDTILSRFVPKRSRFRALLGEGSAPAGNLLSSWYGKRFVWIAALYAMAAATPFGHAQAPGSTWTPPHTPWGDPDLQGVWTSDDSYGVPFERPRRYGDRKLLNDQEYTDRAKEVDLLATSIRAGVTPNAGYWVQHQGVEAQPYGSNWSEYARRASRQTSLIVDPEDGHIPPLTQQGMFLRAAQIVAARKARPESWEDFSMYGRCITRGVLGSMLPVMYSNGTQILQAPGLIAIRYEMIHETRIVPLDSPGEVHPHLASGLRSYMGDPRGHWEGNTLVIETTNFIGGRLGIGANGEGVHYSDGLRLIERFTRSGTGKIDYSVTVDDPKTFTRPWTIAFPITQETGYRIFEYACHEGNYSMLNMLSAARAEEKAAAEKQRVAASR
jgi:hypothetical protein